MLFQVTNLKTLCELAIWPTFSHLKFPIYMHKNSSWFSMYLPDRTPSFLPLYPVLAYGYYLKSCTPLWQATFCLYYSIFQRHHFHILIYFGHPFLWLLRLLISMVTPTFFSELPAFPEGDAPFNIQIPIIHFTSHLCDGQITFISTCSQFICFVSNATYIQVERL